MFNEPLISLKSLALFFASFNAIFLMIYLAFTKNERKQSRILLQILIFCLASIVFEHAIQYSRLYRYFSWLTYASTAFYFLIGPFFYFYLKSLTGSKLSFRPFDLFHLLPFFYEFYNMLPFYNAPDEVKINYINSFFDSSVSMGSNYFFVLVTYKIHFFVYAYFSHRYVTRFVEDYKQESANDTIEYLDRIQSIMIYIKSYLIVSLFSTFFLDSNRGLYIVADYINLLILSFFIHFALYFQLRSQHIALEPLNKEKYQKSKLDNSFLTAKVKKIEEKMRSDKPFLNHSLKLADLAKLLNITSHQLSQIINDEFKSNFYDFINSYRIEEAKKRLLSHPHYSLSAIADDCGFNSYVSFYRVFKKQIGKTPSDFLKESE